MKIFSVMKSPLDYLKIIRGDITLMNVDAIVNAANSSLMGGGGVDGAIHRAGGLEILHECRKIVARQGGCKTGEAVITTAGRLSANFVIHTVGPVWQGGNHGEAALLSSCYTSCLSLAEKNNCKTISFPNISTGVYGFPKDKAAKVSINAILQYPGVGNLFDEIMMVCFDEENFRQLNDELLKQV